MRICVGVCHRYCYNGCSTGYHKWISTRNFWWNGQYRKKGHNSQRLCFQMKMNMATPHSHQNTYTRLSGWRKRTPTWFQAFFSSSKSHLLAANRPTRKTDWNDSKLKTFEFNVVKTILDGFPPFLWLFCDGMDNTIDGGFKERCNVQSERNSYTDHKQAMIILPRKLQLAWANSNSQIFVSESAQSDVLWFAFTPVSQFCCLVKGVCHVGHNSILGGGLQWLSGGSEKVSRSLTLEISTHRYRTFITPAGNPLWIQKWRLASLSVTNGTRTWLASSSGINPASTATRHIFSCCAPYHLFGWDKTNSVVSSIEPHQLSPITCTSSIYVWEQRNRYRRKSAKTLTAFFLSSKGSFSLISSIDPKAFSQRWSLNVI